jgi:hypothetical protein
MSSSVASVVVCSVPVQSSQPALHTILATYAILAASRLIIPPLHRLLLMSRAIRSRHGPRALPSGNTRCSRGIVMYCRSHTAVPRTLSKEKCLRAEQGLAATSPSNRSNDRLNLWRMVDLDHHCRDFPDKPFQLAVHTTMQGYAVVHP